MTMEEASWQRDKRLRDEEARLVRFEEHLGAVDDRTKATHELLLEERGSRRRAEEEFAKHMAEDDRRFSSIDSRLQGIQAQLSTISDTLNRTDSRLKTIEAGESDRSAVQKFLSSTWTHIVGGGGVVAAGVALVKLLEG